MKKNLKKQNGITLIALLVIILILLILAGITINMLLGEEGSTSTPIIKNNGSTVEITLGRYTFAGSSEITPGEPTLIQKGSEYGETTIAHATAGILDKKYKAGSYYYELSDYRTSNEQTNKTGTNTTAKELEIFYK